MGLGVAPASVGTPAGSIVPAVAFASRMGMDRDKNYVLFVELSTDGVGPTAFE